MRTMRLIPYVLALALGATVEAQNTASSGQISGRVLDGATSAPLVNAEVQLSPFRPLSSRASFTRPAIATTGPDGAFLFDSVAPGQYRLFVSKAGYMRLGPADVPPITLAAGRGAAVGDIRLTRGAVITGQLLDPRGEPLPEMSVVATPRRGSRITTPPPPPTSTNDAGEFRISGLPPGEYVIAAHPRNRPALFGSAAPASSTTFVATYYPGVADIEGAQSIAVPSGQTIGNLQFTMLTAPAFEISGIVVDETGRPVGGAVVHAMPAASSGFMPLRGSARSETDGSFRLGGMPQGSYRLSATMPVVYSDGTGPTGMIGGIVTGPGPNGVDVTVHDANVPGVRLVVSRK